MSNPLDTHGFSDEFDSSDYVQTIVPADTYFGVISGIIPYYDAGNFKIAIRLQGNEDKALGALDIDGQIVPVSDQLVDNNMVYMTVWIPRSSDQADASKRSMYNSSLGKMKRLSDNLGIDLNTTDKVNEAISSQALIDIIVSVVVKNAPRKKDPSIIDTNAVQISKVE